MAKLAELGIRFRSFVKECSRVLQITKKPSTEEFKVIFKVTAAGVALIGLIGFIINMAGRFLF